MSGFQDLALRPRLLGAHHEAWLQSELNQARVLRGLWGAARGVRQLARKIQSRATDAGTQGALPARRPKSYPPQVVASYTKDIVYARRSGSLRLPTLVSFGFKLRGCHGCSIHSDGSECQR